MSVPQRLATESYPVTALDTLVVGSTRYLAVGLSNGSLRLYRNSGSGWSSAWLVSAHSAKVVGVKLVVLGSTRYVVSSDLSGDVRVSRESDGAQVSVLASRLTSALSQAVGSDASGVLVAVAGQKDGVARVEVMRLSTAGDLSALTGFNVGTQALAVVDVAFVASGSADVVVGTNVQVSRWNYSSSTNSYGQAYAIADTPSRQVSVRDGRLWTSGSGVKSCHDVGTGAQVAGFGAGFLTTDVLALNANECVTGEVFRATLNDTYHTVRRWRLHQPQEVSSPILQCGLMGELEDEVLSLAQDGGISDLFYVGCLNGEIWAFRLPDITPYRGGHVGLNGTLFQVLQGRIASVITTPPPAFGWAGDTGFGIRRVGLLDVATGDWTSSTVMPGVPRDFGINSMMRLSPSGNVLYLYELGNARLSGWVRSGSSMVQQYSASYAQHWWPVAVDDSKVGLLRMELNDQWGTYPNITYRYRVRVRFITSSGVVEDFGLDALTDMAYITGDPNLVGNYLRSLRWDMNAPRSLFALMGSHYTVDGNGNVVSERRILVFRRSGSSWVRSAVLGSGDFPSGVYPTMVTFHDGANVLYVGLSNGRLRIYRMNSSGQFQGYSELVPTLGSLGAVSSLDIANFVRDGLNYTAIVFGGPEGLSVWVGFVCQPGWLNEVHFYTTDIAFFPEAGMGYIQVDQPDPSEPPYLIYSNGLVMSSARLEGLPTLPCPQDVNRDGVVDDQDALAVLFAFGGEGYIPADVNCDGVVDDQDLLLVLFGFGQSC